MICAVGPWLFSEPMVLRGLAAGAAATAVVGAVVMRRWDTAAGKRVADLTRARASDEWRHEERVAELETDLDESRELRTKLEHKLRAKRAELQGLRNEHAALLRRYATAETERASALEGRRLLAIETSAPARAALPAGTSGDLVPAQSGGTEPGLRHVAAEAADPSAPEATVPTARAAASVLYAKANAALERLAQAGDARLAQGAPWSDASAKGASEDEASEGDGLESDAFEGDGLVSDGAESDGSEGDASGSEGDRPGSDASESNASEKADDSSVAEDAAAEGPVHSGSAADADAAVRSNPTNGDFPNGGPSKGGRPKGAPVKDGAGKGAPTGGGSPKGGSRKSAPATGEAGQEGEARGKPEAVGGHERAAATNAPTPTPTHAAETARPSALSTAPETAPVSSTAAASAAAAELKPAPKPMPPSGHFAVPTAVAVAPASPPVRRPSVEGGFDFFGTQTQADALEAVQNEDLADVVGQEALALHKAESEAQFKPADEDSRGVGQVIDLTAHDETEQIDVAELRGAVS